MEGIWPLVILWILFSVFGSRKKKPPAGSRQSAVEGETSAPVSLPDTFRQALEELKRAEREVSGQAPQLELKPQPKPRQEYRPRQFAPKPVARAAKKKSPDVVEVESDESSETVFTPEGKADFDDDAESIIARRREAVQRRGVRQSTSINALTPEQLARRGGRPDLAIGGQAEHDEWHAQVQATDAAQTRGRAGAQKRHSVLGRYADGSAKGAIILAEILGKPKAS